MKGTQKAVNPNHVAFMGKQWWKRFGQGIMPTLSKLSKAFLLPIALLPIAGIFLGVGSAIYSNVAENSVGWYIGQVINKMGDVCFGNLPILFSVSVAMAYTKDSGVAAITAIVGFLVMNAMQAALLSESVNVEADGKSHLFNLLWYKDVPNKLITANLGVNSLNTGVLAGIFVGAIAAWCYNKFHDIQLPSAIGFFSGTKFVPIVMFVAVIPLSFIFMIIWPVLGKGLAYLGQESGRAPGGLDSMVFEIIERSLVPFGLHHVFYAPLWWTNAGGSIAEAFQNATDQQKADFVKAYIEHFGTKNGLTFEEIKNHLSGIEDLWKAMGDQTMSYKINAHLDQIDYNSLDKLGLHVGRFQSGKYGFMLFGLPAAAAAMYLNVPKENRKSVMGIYFSAAFTCFLTGITEPLEYTFLFLAPWLFYGVHMPLAALSFLAAGALHTHVSMTVSGGAIDFIVFGLIPFFANHAMQWTQVFGIILVGLVMGVAYFFAFYFAVKYGKVMVPGRDGKVEIKLFTKQDFKDKKSDEKVKTSDAEQARMMKAEKIIEFLGGEANITDVDACASRLRLTVVDSTKADVEAIKSLGGAKGALVKGKNIQIVYGGEQEAIKPRMIKILEKQRTTKTK